MKTHTPLLSEILKKVHNAKTKPEKIAILKEHDCEQLRMIVKSSFDPAIEWVIPEGEVPFTRNEGGNDALPLFKKENMFIQMLEGLHHSEADLIIAAKDKKLHKAYKGLSEHVVKDAFGWNDEYQRS